MKIENLIERLKKPCWGESAHLVDDQRLEAAEALSSLQAELEEVKAERDRLISRTKGECWACVRRYECNSRRGPHSRCWEFDEWLLKDE